jgi:hypothetical protein
LVVFRSTVQKISQSKEKDEEAYSRLSREERVNYKISVMINTTAIAVHERNHHLFDS